MSTHTCFSLVGVLCLVLVSAPFIVWGQTGDAPWERYNQAGMEAYQQGNDDEAENQFLAALQIAKNFGPEDPRLATSLNNLGGLYRTRKPRLRPPVSWMLNPPSGANIHGVRSRNPKCRC